MNNIVLEIWDDECEKVTFYTVKKEGAHSSEADKFFEKYENDRDYKDQVDELLSLVLKVIGDEYGAIAPFFNRQKNDIAGLPPKGRVCVENITFHYPEFPFRLYALRINNREDIVVLFNGGIKEGRTDQESKDLSLKFNEAQDCAKRIEAAIREGMILVDEENRKLISFDGTEDIIL